MAKRTQSLESIVFRLKGRKLWYTRRWRASKGGTLGWHRTCTDCLVHDEANELAWRWRAEDEELRRTGRLKVNHGSRPPREHVEDYMTFKREDPDQKTPQYLDQVRLYLDEFVAESGIRSIDDITQELAAGSLERVRRRGRRQAAPVAEVVATTTTTAKAKPAANAEAKPAPNKDAKPTATLRASTLNARRAALKAWTKWLHLSGRLERDPLAYLKRFRPRDGDSSEVRRGMEIDEANRLLAAARDGQPREGLSGRDRWALYWAALATGFRRGELASLRVRDWKLDAEQPHVLLENRSSKGQKRRHERWQRQPLHQGFVPLMRAWLAGRDPKSACWPSLASARTAKMIRADLEAAGVPLANADGETVKFHSLRHTYVTQLVLAKVPVDRVCRLARHARIEITMSVYNHILDTDLAADVGRVTYDASESECHMSAHSMSRDEPQGTTDDAIGGVDPVREPETPQEVGTDMSQIEPKAADRDRTDNPLITKQIAANKQSGEHPENAGVAAHSDTPTNASAERVRGRGRRDRAAAGVEPDLGRAFERIADLVAMEPAPARAGGG